MSKLSEAVERGRELLSEVKMPPKGVLNAAVKAMRLYLGSVGYASPRQEERFYQRATKAVTKVVKASGLPHSVAWEQIEAQARKQGVLRPQPGKDM